MIEVRIAADSINNGNRLTTFVLTYPRFIHAQFMTHRMFSRNAASSRAIPTKKVIELCRTIPVEPVFWGKSQKGMQASEELQDTTEVKRLWDEARENAIKTAESFIELGLHKQLANRILEPFMHMTTICTATDWNNFFNLRIHEDAQPEIQYLAKEMYRALENSKPNLKKMGEWHLPFADKYLEESLTLDQLKKISMARCARVSYLNFEGNIDHDKDYQLHDDLTKSGHWSPAEHLATPGENRYYGNFNGWKQYRKEFINENMSGCPARLFWTPRGVSLENRALTEVTVKNVDAFFARFNQNESC